MQGALIRYLALNVVSYSLVQNFCKKRVRCVEGDPVLGPVAQIDLVHRMIHSKILRRKAEMLLWESVEWRIYGVGLNALLAVLLAQNSLIRR